MVVLAAIGAGTINTVVGSGSLLTFPTLLALGVPPITANVSNNIGLVAGGVSGVVGYRRELAGQRLRLIRLVPASATGALLGAYLLLTLSEAAFEAVVPVLVLVGVLLVVVQPRLAATLRRRRVLADPAQVGVGTTVAVGATGVYGGYFGAAQGVILVGVLGLGLHDTDQRVNAVKNVLALVANTVAAAFFLLVAEIDWSVVGLIALGSTLGGILGARVGRRLPSVVYRSFVVIVGLTAAVALALT